VAITKPGTLDSIRTSRSSHLTMQISQIVLYSQTGKTRTVHFRLGALNVVTGISASGKSALLHIVEYCLGRGTSTVPEGVISGSVDWFAVLLQLANQQAFIARR
jgi:hypothetical protein